MVLSKNTFMQLTAVFVLAFSLQTAADKPNILIVVLDDFGTGHFAPVAKQLELDEVDPDFKAYTDGLGETYDKEVALDAARRAMPFMETLAEQGAVFSRAFAASSLCAPSRQGILTGTNPTQWGAYRNIDINVCGLPKGRCLVDRFQAVDYNTGYVGKWHVGARDHSIQEKILANGGSDEEVIDAGYWGSVCERDHPLNNGFDYAFFYNRWECEFYNSKLIWENRKYTGKQSEYNTDQFTRQAMDFMGLSLDEGKPFFMELALHAVHIPLDVDAPANYAKRFNTGYQSIDRFYSHIYGVDQSIKRIVDMLKERGEWDNTILFFMSDNGATCKVGDGDLSLVPGNGQYRGHKGQYYLGGTRVPLMMIWPDKIKKPIHVEQAVSLMDVMPTALDAAGADIPDNIDGRSLLPIIEGKELVQHKQLYFAGIHAPAWGFAGKKTLVNAQQKRDLWHGAWAIVEGDYILRYVGTLDPELEQEFPDGREAFFSLYNMKGDPLEQNDLYATNPEVAERMKASYNQYAETLPPPHGWDRKRWEELVPNSGKYPKRKPKVVEPE
ncbi:Arylsulfatase [Pontiella desulfatans]|uniref:Arylsulfatase n=1 Tax=Pontiella desulfatans TaxID=2750659 RepID=A0A6C2U249_PONDE|nr:sulfatase-like hydrolase/transferase [Pontiella desulfatans]SPS73918.1 sulfatase S1_44 [Kiritimatiellales bacterium]VGO14060.1 Arylsulfatase [Pontiella desulfatans]